MTANAVEPGFVKTNLKVPFPFSIFSFMRGQADGIPGILTRVADVSGAFFNSKGVAVKSSKITYDEGVAKRLWQMGAELTHLEADR